MDISYDIYMDLIFQWVDVYTLSHITVPVNLTFSTEIISTCRKYKAYIYGRLERQLYKSRNVFFFLTHFQTTQGKHNNV